MGFPAHKLPVRFRSSADAPIDYLTSRRRSGADLIPDFLDADLADFI
jgi:hypothetical protein